MLSWKLLGDLLPQELRLECERAGIKASQKDSHNFVKLAKYILSNGYDPENFYFNTIYKTDKSDPLFGMMNGNVSDSRANAPLFTASGFSTSAGPVGTSPPSSDGTSAAMMGLFSKISQDIQKLVSIMEVKKTVTASGVGVDRSKQRPSPPDLPVWDSFETESSSSSNSGYSQSSTSSGYSQFSTSSGQSGSGEFFGRHYNKSLLIKDGICLAYQHGNCTYGGQTVKHENAFGKKVLHVCGLCWTDSPYNQCHSPAIQCPGPEHNL